MARGACMRGHYPQGFLTVQALSPRVLNCPMCTESSNDFRHMAVVGKLCPPSVLTNQGVKDESFSSWCVTVPAAPITMVVYLSIKISQPDVMDQSATRGLNSAQAVWYTFGIVRAFRWVSRQHLVVIFSLSLLTCV